MSPSRPLVPYAALVGVLALGVLVMAFGVEVRMTGEAGVIATGLPDRIGDWRGEAQMFCLNKDCGRRFVGEECEGLERCPTCGSEVNSMSLTEYEMLPKDTILNRKAYHHPAGRTVHASVVLSGQQRSSLHRPELCLSVSGYEVEAIRDLAVPLADGRRLQVRVLELLANVQMPDGRVRPAGSYYAYWFVSRNRLTASHLARMILMAIDKVVFSRIDRWAYVSVAGPRGLEDDAYLEEARDFIRDFYPRIEVAGNPAPPD